VAEDICRGLAARGHKVGVLTAHWGDLPRFEVRDGVQVWRIPSLRRWPYKGDMRAMLGYVLAALPAGLRLIRRWKPDVLHAHFAVPSGAATYALSRISGLPYLLTTHLGDVPGGVPEKTDRWFRWIFPLTPPIWRSAVHVVAVSAFTRDLAWQHYRVQAEVIPNGVDTARLNPGEIQVGQPPRILFAGRFMPQKNLLALTRILAQVRELPWTCTLVGDGPLRTEVEAEVTRYGLQERITLTGWVSPDQVTAYMQQSDILFMPSLSEGMPVVGVQALSMGLALVVSRIGGFADLVQDGQNGYLIPPEDETGFAQTLCSLLTSPQELLALRHASRRMALRFDLEHIVSAYERILRAFAEGQEAPDAVTP
jgi:glycosyltransferase involved in cell wall biosynthesis